jgi:hypothetical protein
MKPGPARRDARDIELNTSDEEDLAEAAGLGPERARRLVEHRPFRSWDDVQKLEGFTQMLVDTLQKAGAQLGAAEGADKKAPSDEHREQLQLEQRAGKDLDEGVLGDGRKGAGPDRRPS